MFEYIWILISLQDDISILNFDLTIEYLNLSILELAKF